MRTAYAMVFGLFVLSAATAHGDLTHRYSFNDGTAKDSVGTAHGLLVNGPTVTNGVLVFSPTTNNGTNLDPATGQYVDLPNNIAATRALTLEAWTTYRGGTSWQRIADFGNNAWRQEIQPTDKTTVGYFGEGFIMLTPSNGNGHPIAQISVDSWGGSGDTDFVGGVSPFPRNAEAHVVFTHDPDAGVQRLYVNGTLWGQAQARYDASHMNYRNYWLGRSQFYQDPFYNGTINEFRIYDHGMTAAEVSANFAAGPNVIVPEPACVGLAVIAAALLLRRER